MDNTFEVYICLNPLKPGLFKYGKYKFRHSPFYVGKAKNSLSRIDNHMREAEQLAVSNKCVNKHKCYTILKILNSGNNILYRAIKCATEQEAFDLEEYLVKLIGRAQLGTGPLTNMTRGGDGVAGQVVSEETRRKLSEAGRGRKASEYQKLMVSISRLNHIKSAETIEKLRAAAKLQPPRTKAQREAQAAKMRGRTHSAETIKKMKIAAQARRARGKTEKELQAIANNRVTYAVTTPTGKRIAVSNLKEFCNEQGLSIHCMRKIACGDQIQHKGFICRWQ